MHEDCLCQSNYERNRYSMSPSTWQWGEAGDHIARVVDPHLQITELESGNLSIVQRRCNENTIDAGLFKRP